LQRELHTLKGNAGTLGITALASKAAQLEMLCKSAIGLAEFKGHLDQLALVIEEARQCLLQAIALLDPNGLTATSQDSSQAEDLVDALRHAEPLSAQELVCLRHLNALLEASDLEALQYFAEMRFKLDTHQLLYATLDAALQDLDLEKARAICNTALAQGENWVGSPFH
jgi:HPt (histidine-containing phosphotransfer) domain-containing protein